MHLTQQAHLYNYTEESRGGGTPLYKLYPEVCASPKGMVYEPFCLKTGIEFEHFDLKLGMFRLLV